MIGSFTDHDVLLWQKDRQTDRYDNYINLLVTLGAYPHGKHIYFAPLSAIKAKK